MKKIKNKYVIMQGVMTASGCGDYYQVACVGTLKEARKLFNRLKRDTKGWVKNGNNSYLETFLQKNFEYIDSFKINL